MKRKLLCILLSAIIVFSFCSCGNGNIEQKEDNNTVESENNFIAESEDNTYLEQQKEVENIQKENELEFQKLSLGESIDIDYLSMSLDNIEISNGYEFNVEHEYYVKKQPFTPSGGMVLLSLRGLLTNKSTKEMNHLSILAGTIIVNGNEYTASLKCFNMQEPEECLSIVSQQTLDYFIYTEIPENLVNNIENCEFKFGFSDKLEEDIIENKPFEDLTYLYSVSGILSIQKSL